MLVLAGVVVLAMAIAEVMNAMVAISIILAVMVRDGH